MKDVGLTHGGFMVIRSKDDLALSHERALEEA